MNQEYLDTLLRASAAAEDEDAARLLTLHNRGVTRERDLQRLLMEFDLRVAVMREKKAFLEKARNEP